MVRIFVSLLVAGCSFGCAATLAFFDDSGHDEKKAASIFEDRIMPIFRSPDPSSCVQCHLSSVDLKNYILPSHEKTFVSLRDQGLIDLDHPAKSKILKLIEMGNEDQDKHARLIHEDMRKAEFEAFTSWIEACCEDDRLRELPRLAESELAQPEKPLEVIRHARKSRLVDSFVRNVWSQRMRCFPCHTPSEIKPNQKVPRQKFEDWERQFGDAMIIFQETPEDTIRYLVEMSRETEGDDLPLINLEDPAKSLLVLKPTAKLPPRVDGEFAQPSYSEPVSHMGGLKMHKDDQSYKSFIAWIKDYSNVVNERYAKAEDLPADNWIATKRVLRIKELPDDWQVGMPVQLFVYARSDDPAAWSSEPVAFTQGTVTPRHVVNGALFLLRDKNHVATSYQNKTDKPADRDQPAPARRRILPPGSYLVKVYADRTGQMEIDPTIILGADDFVGQIEIENARWRIGFPKAEVVSGTKLSKD